MTATTEAAAAATLQIKSSNAPKVCDKKLFFIYLFIIKIILFITKENDNKIKKN